MEEAQEILLNSLQNSGVSLPTGISYIQDLTPAALVSICSQSLHLVDDSLSFPTSLPDLMADRFRICTDMASAIKELGYRGDLSFNQFLYPSEEYSYKLVRFLVEKLSETLERGKSADRREIRAGIKADNEFGGPSKICKEKDDNLEVDLDHRTVKTRLKKLSLKTQAPESSHAKLEDAFVNGSLEVPLIQKKDEPNVSDISRSRIPEPRKTTESSFEDVKPSVGKSQESRRAASENEEAPVQRNDRRVPELNQKLAALRELSLKKRNEIEILRSQEMVLKEELTLKTSESQQLEEKYKLLKGTVEMAFDDQYPVEYLIEQLNEQIKSKRQNILILEREWYTVKSPLEKEKGNSESFIAEKPEVQEKLQKVEKARMETEAILSEIKKREDEHSKISAELEKQPKIASRKSYVNRITEITKNSRKQDADIERILQETRELQLESNSIQDRLLRTYALVEETVLRDAKKDPVRQQVYRLLKNIHENFEHVSDNILATDRTRREIAEQEAKLASTAARSLNIDKLQADLDAIRKDNEFLEQRLKKK